ncbi:hypothetical protein BDY24DRAFT_382333 [Mrakia frigida]|uniref:uncharacterized protein n=1 Tax=Mrakia frigida TaxID=29902 RepID=UPI003FCC0D67
MGGLKDSRQGSGLSLLPLLLSLSGLSSSEDVLGGSLVGLRWAKEKERVSEGSEEDNARKERSSPCPSSRGRGRFPPRIGEPGAQWLQPGRAGQPRRIPLRGK